MSLRKKILIIDDDPVFLKMTGRSLLAAGYDVLTAMDGIQGIKIAIEEKPHLIILDIRFPAGGGLETLKKLRLSYKTSSIPVIISTCVDDPELKEAVAAYDVVDYMVKPLDQEKLIQKINEVLKDTF